jgi:hypothetical protein
MVLLTTTNNMKYYIALYNVETRKLYTLRTNGTYNASASEWRGNMFKTYKSIAAAKKQASFEQAKMERKYPMGVNCFIATWNDLQEIDEKLPPTYKPIERFEVIKQYVNKY